MLQAELLTAAASGAGANGAGAVVLLLREFPLATRGEPVYPLVLNALDGLSPGHQLRGATHLI